MPVLRHVGLLATPGARQGDVHTIAEAALAFSGARLTWVGAERDLPASADDGEALDAGGGLVIPGLIDCHTHLGFGGWRAEEMVRRLRGESYAQIAAAGGGIASTMAATRTLGPEALLARCRGFLREMVALGTTCVEAKSGYGLDRATERRLLETYRALDGETVRVVGTYLGAHVVPPEYRPRREEYLRLCEQMTAEVGRESLARFCDVFVEEGAFTAGEARRLFAAARAAGLRPKLHADQLGEGGGAALAAEVGAVSADHLEHASAEGIAALARAGVVAVSLPIAALYLDQAPLPARAFLDAGVAVAVATDFNPGTAPSLHLPLALTLACVRQRMTPAEALGGATRMAARALALEEERGALEPGKSASFAVIDAPSVEHWLYNFRANACRMTVIDGVRRFP
jgi:imidazolonepropionase